MYSTVCDGLRYTLTCIVKESSLSLVDTIVDTGAFWTCYKASEISEELREAQFVNKEVKHLGGFVNGKENEKSVLFHRYDVSQFTIGTIDLGAQTIWITFDDRISDNVLGMDILRKVAYLQYEESNILYFFKNKDELRDFVENS